MKIIIILTLLNLPQETILSLRSLYQNAIESELSAIKLDAYLKTLPPNEPLTMGYMGATKMLLAKYAILPTQKYTYFSEGRQKLDAAVTANPSNLELKYLRYSIQLNSPSFLGYNKNIKEDRTALINGTSAITDHELKVKIISFLVLSAGLSEAERSLLK